MSRHAEAARLRLQQVAAPIANADFPDALRDAAADVLVDGTTLEAAATLTARLLLAAEGHRDTLVAQMQALQVIKARADSAAEAIEAALVEMLSETGAPSLDVGHHTLSLTSGRPAVQITDEAALPAQFLVRQAPRPDKKALAEALKEGPVPGAVLTNSRPGLRRTFRKVA